LAAEQGVADAQLRLGLMYQMGQGVRQNSNVSGKWFRNDAEQGDADGQLLLSLANWSGRGVTQDPIRAYMWVNIAAANGSHEALNERDIMAKKMTPKQMEQAQELASKCMTNNYKSCD
jgi:TPR repeat protein